jgi:hypothetical protein
MELGWAHIFFMLCLNDDNDLILTWGIMVFILKNSMLGLLHLSHVLSQLMHSQYT